MRKLRPRVFKRLFKFFLVEPHEIATYVASKWLSIRSFIWLNRTAIQESQDSNSGQPGSQSACLPLCQAAALITHILCCSKSLALYVLHTQYNMWLPGFLRLALEEHQKAVFCNHLAKY